MEYGISSTVSSDLPRIRELNEMALPAVNSIPIEDFNHFLDVADYFKSIFIANKLVGYLIALQPKRDYDSVNYKYFEDAKTEIGLELAKAQGRIQGKENSLRKKYSELEKKAQSGQMWNDEIQVEAAKLQEEEMKLGQEAQELQAKLANVEYEVTLKVINETADYLNDIGKQLGYDYVLTYSKSNQIILFANDELDITDYVTVKLNKAYAAKTE